MVKNGKGAGKAVRKQFFLLFETARVQDTKDTQLYPAQGGGDTNAHVESTRPESYSLVCEGEQTSM